MDMMAREKDLQSQWPFLCLQVIILAVFAVTIHNFFARKIVRKRLPLPPGPKGLPIVGNLLQLGSSPNKDLYNLATKYGPLMTIMMGNKMTVVATSPAMAEKVLKTHDDTLCGRSSIHTSESEGHSQRNIAMLQVGPHWRFLKKISVSSLFSPHKLDSLQYLRRREVDNTMVGILESSRMGKAVDIKDVMFVCTFKLMANTIFGEEMFTPEEMKEYQESLHEVVTVLGIPNLADHIPFLRWWDPQRLKSRADQAFGKMYGLIEKVLKRRFAKGNIADGSVQNNLLDTLLSLKNEDFRDWDIVGLVSEMFLAGTHSTGTSVVWAMAELMKNPQYMKKCVEEIDKVVGSDQRRITEAEARELPYLKAVMKEAWRLHPPAPFLIPHRAQEDTWLDNGCLIPKDAKVIVNVWGIGRDPTVWKTPEKFDPDRFLTDHRDIDYKGHHFELLPFGSGRRICTGMPLASRMSSYVLASLLQCFEWSLPPTVDDMDMSEKFGIVVDKATPLRLIPKPRLPSYLF